MSLNQPNLLGVASIPPLLATTIGVLLFLVLSEYYQWQKSEAEPAVHELRLKFAMLFFSTMLMLQGGICGMVTMSLECFDFDPDNLLQGRQWVMRYAAIVQLLHDLLALRFSFSFAIPVSNKV